jgi:hypothetical protein
MRHRLADPIRHPDLVRKLVLTALAYNRKGFHAGVLDEIKNLKPECLAGSQWQQAYTKTPPNLGR